LERASINDSRLTILWFFFMLLGLGICFLLLRCPHSITDLSLAWKMQRKLYRDVE
jgi:hypothetical protein